MGSQALIDANDAETPIHKKLEKEHTSADLHKGGPPPPAPPPTHAPTPRELTCPTGVSPTPTANSLSPLPFTLTVKP